jgi:hypothetical protein
MLLGHLLSDTHKPQKLEHAAPEDLFDAQVSTAQFLEELGVVDDEEAKSTAAANVARETFQAVTTTHTDQDKRQALLNLKTPAAVQHLVGMLTAYDWQFVEQAKEIRGYAVAQIIEETKHPDAKVRLRALEMLGKVTEVALFTERVEVKKVELSDQELDQKIKERLNKFSKVLDVVDIKAVQDDIEDLQPKDDDIPQDTTESDE